MASVPPSGFAVIWPATAFLIAVFLLTPARLWWIYLVTVVPTHLALVAVFQPVPFTVALTQIGGNFALAAATAWALRATNGKPPDFGDFRAQLRFVIVAGFVVPAVINTLILLVHLANGRTSDFWLSWRQWIVAGVFPTVTIPPVLIVAYQHISARRYNLAYLCELALVTAACFATCFVVFGGAVENEWSQAVRPLPLPFLFWAAFRLGIGGAGVVMLATGSAIIAQAIRLEGPFAHGTTVEAVIALQAYLTVLSTILMLVAALLEERRRTSDLLYRSEERMSVAAAMTEVGLWQWDEGSKKLWMTDHCRSMFGLAAGSEATPDAVVQVVHPADRARVARALRAGLSSAETAPREFRVVCPSRGERWYALNTRTHFNKDNLPILVSGLFQDVTQRIGANDGAEDLTRRLLTLQDEERRSIARELADFTSQHLVAADLNLAALERRAAANDPAEVQRLTAAAASGIQDALKEIRNFIFLLQPPELDNEALSDVLGRYLDGFKRRTAIDASLRINPAADQAPPEQRRTILRIVQESLANVHRYGGATSVSVDVRCIGGRLHLVVSDNGHAARRLFESEAGEQVLGVPVPGAAARIRQLGGKIEVSNRGARNTVHVAVPMTAPVGD